MSLYCRHTPCEECDRLSFRAFGERRPLRLHKYASRMQWALLFAGLLSGATMWFACLSAHDTVTAALAVATSAVCLVGVRP